VGVAAKAQEGGIGETDQSGRQLGARAGNAQRVDSRPAAGVQVRPAGWQRAGGAGVRVLGRGWQSIKMLGGTRKVKAMAMAKKSVPFVLASLLMAASSCKVSVRPGYIEDDRRDTAQAIEEFHHRLSSEQFEDIYRDAHQALRSTRSREQLLSAMRATRTQFGAFRAVTFSQINIFVRAPIEGRAVYNTTYERGDATEMFLFLKDDNRMRLALYSISPGNARPSGSSR
jgi:hypothetical protein